MLKHKSLNLFLMALCAMSAPVHACINETGTNRRGEEVTPIDLTGQNLKPYLEPRANQAELAAWAKQAAERAKTQPTFQTMNALAAALIRSGRPAEAVDQLLASERKYPGHFETASNLGTAYELMGRNEKALKWILEGVRRNPDDHFGTEWLHVHILKAKLGRLAKPAPGRSILDLNFGHEVMPLRPTRLPVGNAGKALSLFSVAYALRFQLIERTAFVAAPDPMVAGLLLDWANLELLAGALETADVLYDAAARYGSSEQRLIAMRKIQVAKILARTKVKSALLPGRCELCEPPSNDRR